MRKTKTNIEVSINKDQCLTVMITGKREETAKAQHEVITKLQVHANIEIKIPKDHHRFILGKGGKNLHELQLMTNTKISIPDKNNTNPLESDRISITGPKEGINRARHEIMLISEEQVNLHQMLTSFCSMFFHIFFNVTLCLNS